MERIESREVELLEQLARVLEQLVAVVEGREDAATWTPEHRHDVLVKLHTLIASCRMDNRASLS